MNRMSAGSVVDGKAAESFGVRGVKIERRGTEENGEERRGRRGGKWLRLQSNIP
jgi:hypothetical protein